MKKIILVLAVLVFSAAISAKETKIELNPKDSIIIFKILNDYGLVHKGTMVSDVKTGPVTCTTYVNRGEPAVSKCQITDSNTSLEGFNAQFFALKFQENNVPMKFSPGAAMRSVKTIKCIQVREFRIQTLCTIIL